VASVGNKELFINLVVGKTNLMQRFTKNTFNPESRSTIGVDFSSKTVQIGEHRVKAQVWDTVCCTFDYSHKQRLDKNALDTLCSRTIEM
jgi:hypothetical protein